ncbi:hypothetical protein K438DRAFT_1985627 [Mycena galopus ATCC 62051]|nr:hypothetical protein K438DRAFT_1985627 [Mycena galopus ATCC 62051]
MCNLSGRFSCQKCPASSRCAVFCGADVDPQTQQAIPRLLPRSPTEVCCCGHGWISHEDRGCHDITHINYHFRKGGYTPNYCGGFYSDVTNWSYLTICVCMAGWTTHAPLQEIPDPTLGNGSASAGFAPVPVPVQAPPTLPQIGGPRIPSWRGLPPVVAGNTGTRRISSAEHTLPQHSVSSTSPHRSRNNFPSSLGSASAPAASASAGVFSGLVTVLVAIYPLVEPGAHEHPEFPSDHLAFRNEDALDYLTRFNTHGLLVEVNVPRQGLVRPEAFTTQLTSAFPLVAQPTESAPILVRAQLNGHSTHPVDPASDTDSDCDSLPDLQSVTDESDSDSDSDSASDSDPDRDSIYASPRPVSGHTAADFMHRATIISHPSLGEDESTQ